MGGKQSHEFDKTLFNKQWEKIGGSMDGKTLWRNRSQPSR